MNAGTKKCDSLPDLLIHVVAVVVGPFVARRRRRLPSRQTLLRLFPAPVQTIFHVVLVGQRCTPTVGHFHNGDQKKGLPTLVKMRMMGMNKETAMIERTKELAIMQLETRDSAHNSPSTPRRHSPILWSTASRHREARRDQSKSSAPDSRTRPALQEVQVQARTEAMPFTPQTELISRS